MICAVWKCELVMYSPAGLPVVLDWLKPCVTAWRNPLRSRSPWQWKALLYKRNTHSNAILSNMNYTCITWVTMWGSTKDLLNYRAVFDTNVPIFTATFPRAREKCEIIFFGRWEGAVGKLSVLQIKSESHPRQPIQFGSIQFYYSAESQSCLKIF